MPVSKIDPQPQTLEENEYGLLVDNGGDILTAAISVSGERLPHGAGGSFLARARLLDAVTYEQVFDDKGLAIVTEYPTTISIQRVKELTLKTTMKELAKVVLGLPPAMVDDGTGKMIEKLPIPADARESCSLYNARDLAQNIGDGSVNLLTVFDL